MNASLLANGGLPVASRPRDHRVTFTEKVLLDSD
jgi:hypothetical protein